MSVENFINMWTEGLHRKDGFSGFLEGNIIVDMIGTEIRTDDYEIDYDKGIVRLFYKKNQIGIIKLENVKLIY